MHEVLRSTGRPLDTGTQTLMQSRFGHDFSHVRVHTDAKAAESARAVNALAYAVGQQIVFATGAYQPAEPGGRHLLAHELAHTLQQAHSTEQLGRITLSRANDPAEFEAERAADSAVTGATIAVQADTALKVARQQDQPTEDQPGDCSGWEMDPQSFSKRAAEHYVARLGVPSFEVISINCSSLPNWVCNVAVDVRAGIIFVKVSNLDPPNKLVQVESPPHFVCFYRYRCLPTGELIFEDFDCPGG